MTIHAATATNIRNAKEPTREVISLRAALWAVWTVSAREGRSLMHVLRCCCPATPMGVRIAVVPMAPKRG
jgi:hypothetical protein